VDDQFNNSPQLEEGWNTTTTETLDQEEKSFAWPMFSSILQLITNDKRPNSNNNTAHNLQFTDNIAIESQENAYIPMLPIHNDPVRFLKNQEDVLLLDRFPKLTLSHKKYLQLGDGHLAYTRSEIIHLLKELSNNYEALGEIYVSEKYSKLSKYELFNDWISKKSDINNKIEEIISKSSEGQTYKSLMKKSQHLDDEIDKLEKQLIIAKNKKKLVNQQIMETKSLMDIKLNVHNADLENIIQNEETEILLMFKEKQIKSDKYTDVEVSSNLKLQMESLDLLIDQTLESKLKFEQAFNYLADIFDTLNKMETSISTFLQESKIEQIEPILLSNRIYLRSRLNQAKELNFSIVEKIIDNEIKAIEKAMSILNITIPEDEISGTGQVDPSSLNFSNDSIDYHHHSSSDNFSIVNPSKQALQLGNAKAASLSTSPPITTTVTTTANVGGMGFKTDKINKYNLLLNEIKNTKCDKTE
jgi:hypothetical protein